MRRFIAALPALVIVLGLAGAALANHSKPVQGVVKSVDPVKHVVTLDDGSRFTAGPGVEVDGLAPGERVTFYYHDWGKGKVVVSYELGWQGTSS
jgi:hypothetical protein